LFAIEQSDLFPVGIAIAGDQDTTMLPSAHAESRPANDNFLLARGVIGRSARGRFAPPQYNRRVVRPKPLRIALQLVLMASFSAIVLLALSGAFLIGLFLVGLFAAAIAAFAAIRGYMPKPPPLWRFDRRVIGSP
jgi:hypothetical protein